MRDLVGERFVRSTFDELMYDVLMELRHPDFVCSPRGSEVKEILVPRLCLTDPRARLLCSERRNANYGFAVGEFLWYWRGSQSLDEMTYYNKRMPGFSDDGETLNSAYGYRLRNWWLGGENGTSQWDTCKKTLIEDSDSRRAIMLINDPRDQYRAVTIGSKDVPCTLSLQFFVRENRLHLHTHMRSNDVHWGLTYDLFSFTLFQECMLLELRKHYPDLELGRYFHTAGSLHVYDRHYKLSEDMIEERRKTTMKLLASAFSNRLNTKERMAPLDSLAELDILQIHEHRLRTIDGYIKDFPLDEKIQELSDTAAWMLIELWTHRKKRDKEDV